MDSKRLTFAGDDKLGRELFCQRLEHFLTVEHDFVEGSLVVSLNAPFGSGKTTFLSMWHNALQQRQNPSESTPSSVLLNAWEDDYCGDPLSSLVSGLIATANSNPNSDAQKKVQVFVERMKDIGWFITGLANGFVSKATGLDPFKAGELAEQKKEERGAKPPDPFEAVKQRMAALKEFKTALKEAFGGDCPKAFVFVDDLDRCRPDYAISYLEVLKHIFDVHGLVFVLAVDAGQLASSARALFGADLNFAEYFRKFVHRSFSLPEPNNAELSNLAQHFASLFLEREGKRACMMDLQRRTKNIVDLITALRMTPRQIHESFRIIGHVAACTEEKRGKLLWCVGVGTIMMVMLKLTHHALYISIGNGKQDHAEVCRLLVNLLGSRDAAWWIFVYLTGNERPDYAPKIDIDATVKEFGLESIPGLELGQFIAGWGYPYSDRFRQIYRDIEGAVSFGQLKS